MKNQKTCPLCESNNVKTQHDNVYDKSYHNPGKFTLIMCGECGLEFLNPLLTEKEVGKYYPDEYYSFHDYNALALQYHKVSAKYHSRKSKAFNLLISIFSPLLYTYYIDSGKSVLEIGCGNGMQLGIYKDHGMKTRGLEPYGPKLTEKERELGIERKSVKDAKYTDGEFDYIIMKDVIEHVPDQTLLLERCRRWLKPGGKMIITTQNTNSLWKRVFKENWFGYDVPRHFYNYNGRNISVLLRKHGFNVVRVRVYDTPFMLDGSMKFHVISKYKKKEDDLMTKIIFSNFSKIIFTPISLIVGYLGQGSLMEVECSKS